MAPPAAPAGGSALARVSMPVRIAAGLMAVVVVGFAYWLIFYSDVAQKIDSEKKRQANLNQNLAAANQAKASYLADKDRLGILQEHARDFNKVLPADKQEPAFVQSIRDALNTAGVDLLAYSPVPEQPQSFYVKDPMTLEISGKFHQVVKFFYEVGKLDRIINMENIQLGEPKIAGDEITLHGRCLATAFHTLPPKPAGAPAPPGGKK